MSHTVKYIGYTGIFLIPRPRHEMTHIHGIFMETPTSSFSPAQCMPYGTAKRLILKQKQIGYDRTA